MEITITEGDTTLIKINGRLDTVNSPGFEQKMAPILAGGMRQVLVDCSELNYISSSGLRVFLTLRKASAAKGGNLTIRGMRPEIREIFDMTGFTTLFDFEP